MLILPPIGGMIGLTIRLICRWLWQSVFFSRDSLRVRVPQQWATGTQEWLGLPETDAWTRTKGESGNGDELTWDRKDGAVPDSPVG
ncbi:MAG: hypothetical protein HQL78_11855 [Magnetococcales bacterium]|nr:hypothetical protein [Magnetococcales bacterium]